MSRRRGDSLRQVGCGRQEGGGTVRQVYQAGFWIKIEWKAPGRPHVRLSRGHLGLHDMLFRLRITISYVLSTFNASFMLYIGQYVMFLKKKRVSFIQHKINLTEVRVRLVYPLCVLNTIAFIFLKKIHQIFICFPGNLKEGGKGRTQMECRRH